jgi:formylglycine-generating enzyme required for sulfatase activity
VEISQGFYLGKYVITQEQWEAVMEEKPWDGKEYVRSEGNHPAVYISWYDVQGFIQRLNQAEGEEVYRLPTEAEWEYACRAGSLGRYTFGDDDSTLGQYAWLEHNSGGATHEVGQKQPNGWGLYDMHGNVFEWCQDWYARDYYKESPVDDPPGPSAGSGWVLRGGSSSDVSRICRCSFRRSFTSSRRNVLLGFRVAAVLPAKPSRQQSKPESGSR